MKNSFIKVIGLFIIISSLFGCSLVGSNKPKDRVEALLMSYQNNSDSIVSELDDYLKTLTIQDEYFEDYKKVYLRQYQDLKYEIKNETIDGDNAIVTAQIEVYDYYKTENDVNNYIAENSTNFNNDGVYDTLKALKYRMDELNKSNSRVQYTIDFHLTKVNDDWSIDNLSDEDLQKIHGTYAH